MNNHHIRGLAIRSVFLVIACTTVLSCTRYTDQTRFALPKTFTQEEIQLANKLRRHVKTSFGVERNVRHQPDFLDSAAMYIEAELKNQTGLSMQVFEFRVPGKDNQTKTHIVKNIEFTIEGTAKKSEIIVIGAHYDSALTFPGANDNGSGSAAAIELARKLSQGKRPERTIRILFFVNEEEPYFSPRPNPSHEWMGSRRYAGEIKTRGDNVVAMISLETMGYYTEAPKSQCLAVEWKDKTDEIDAGPKHRNGLLASDTKFPIVQCKFWGLLSGDWFGDEYAKGDFLAFVGDPDSKELVRDSVVKFRESQSAQAKLKAHGLAMTRKIEGVDWSDHRSFWNQGFRGFMVTDTAPLRYPYYHWPEDTGDRINYEIIAKVVLGLEHVIRYLADRS